MVTLKSEVNLSPMVVRLMDGRSRGRAGLVQCEHNRG